jgi:CheY-like chemotaxis protein
MSLEIRRRRIGAGEKAIEIVDIIGRLDTPGSGLLRSTVQDILKEGCPRIAVNLTECVEIHRELMGTFHSLGRACQRAGGGLVIYGASRDVLEYINKFGDRSLAPLHRDERSAIIALGGHVGDEASKEKETEAPVIVALGSDPIFRGVFWKLSALGGRGIAKYDNIQACFEYIGKRPVHSILIDASLPSHDVIQFIRQIRTTPMIRTIGIFVIGLPSQRNIGRAVIEQGADFYVPLVFTGEEIIAKLDARTFFARLKEVYERFDSRIKTKENR